MVLFYSHPKMGVGTSSLRSIDCSNFSSCLKRNEIRQKSLNQIERSLKDLATLHQAFLTSLSVSRLGRFGKIGAINIFEIDSTVMSISDGPNKIW